MPAEAPAATTTGVIMPEDIVLLRQQVRHRMTGRDIGQEPEGVLQVRQQAHVRVREWRPRPGLEMFDGPGRIPRRE